MKIVLIGFMATGKSSVAPFLAKRLGLENIEMDDLIIQKGGGKSIEKIFADDGEAAFREFELAVAKDLKTKNNVVISTGGGVVTNEQTWAYLAEQAIVVGLFAPFETILKRVGSDIPRPLFKDQAAAMRLYEQRAPLYNKYSDIQVSTDDESIEEVVKEIMDKVQKL